MLKNKFNRHTIAFLTIALVSVSVHLTARADLVLATWLLLGLALLAALLTLITK